MRSQRWLLLLVADDVLGLVLAVTTDRPWSSLRLLLVAATGLAAVWLLLRGQAIAHLLISVLTVVSVVAAVPGADTVVAGVLAVVGVPAIAQVVRRRVADTEESWRTQAHEDPLTGVLNRRGVEAWCADGAATISLLLVDVDGLGARNKAEGHAAGDELLRTVGTTLQGQVRTGQAVARWGGDEFVFVARHADAAALARVFAEVLAALTPLGASVSGGAVAGFSHGLHTTIDEADRHLRKAGPGQLELG